MVSVESSPCVFMCLADIVMAKDLIRRYLAGRQRPGRIVPKPRKRPERVQPGRYRLIACCSEGRYHEVVGGLEYYEVTKVLNLIMDELGQCNGLSYVVWPEALPMPFALLPGPDLKKSNGAWVLPGGRAYGA